MPCCLVATKQARVANVNSTVAALQRQRQMLSSVLAASNCMRFCLEYFFSRHFSCLRACKNHTQLTTCTAPNTRMCQSWPTCSVPWLCCAVLCYAVLRVPHTRASKGTSVTRSEKDDCEWCQKPPSPPPPQKNREAGELSAGPCLGHCTWQPFWSAAAAAACGMMLAA